jgi:hypothetical protein
MARGWLLKSWGWVRAYAALAPRMPARTNQKPRSRAFLGLTLALGAVQQIKAREAMMARIRARA